jgi:hypothetical protein
MFLKKAVNPSIAARHDGKLDDQISRYTKTNPSEQDGTGFGHLQCNPRFNLIDQPYQAGLDRVC